MGAEVIGKSGMGDDLNFVPTNKHTLQTDKWENVWIIGDAPINITPTINENTNEGAYFPWDYNIIFT